MKLTHKLGLAGTSISLSGIAFGWGIFPWLLKMEIGKIKGLAPNSESREFWEKIPFELIFKVYVFNITNHMDVQNKGEPPILQEVGPYVYGEVKEKAEIIDYEEDDSTTFHFKNTYYFKPDLTAPLTGNETIIILHPVLMGLVLIAEREKPGFLPMVNKAIPILFNKPESVFLKTTVYDILYGGIVFNCTTKDFGASAVCAVMRKESPDLEPISPTNFRFSVFHLKNGTKDPNKFQVNRGTVDYTKVGKVMKLNDKTKLSIWKGKPCNDVEGTDGTVFPPDVKQENELVTFNVELCKAVPATYVKPSEFKSIRTLRFNVTLGDMRTQPALKCLCTTDTNCLKKGVLDLRKCMGVPVIGSMPHFYDAHEDYLNSVKGLNPSEEKHAIYFDIEPMTGTPLHARKRFQFSFPLHKINKVDITKNLPEALVPFFWVEESVDLPDQFIDKLNRELFLILKIVDVIKWTIVVAGAAIMSAGVGLYYKKQNSLTITPSSGSSKMGSTDFLADKLGRNHEMGLTNQGYM